MNIWKILDHAATSYPHDIAIVDNSKHFTYCQLRNRALSLAAFFSSQGICARERIAVLEVNSAEFMESYFASAALGTILLPINHRLSKKDLSYILADSEAQWIIASTKFEKQIIAALSSGEFAVRGILWIGDHDYSPNDEGLSHVSYAQALNTQSSTFEPAFTHVDDTAHLYYTSGTTGEPKGVPLTHRNVVTHAKCAAMELNLSRDDIWGHIAPLFHLADAWAVFAITLVGGRHVMLDHFDAAATMHLIEDKKITISNLIPTMLNLIVGHPDAGDFDFRSLRVILSGGAPIAKEVVRNIMALFGCDYIQTYGMTETSPYLLLGILPKHLEALPTEDRLTFKAKTGRRFGAVELKVVNARGAPVATDDCQVGEIWVRGETVTQKYWNKPKATAAAFSNGWFKTGDLAVIDNEGFVTIVDRKKDMIITGGENVYSTEVESVLYEHKAILEAAIFGVPDATWGESVTGAVALKHGQQLTEESLIRFCRDRLAGYKTPKKIAFMKSLPKTGSGKISKIKLKKQINDHA